MGGADDHEDITVDLEDSLAMQCRCCHGDMECPLVGLESKSGSGSEESIEDAEAAMEAAFTVCEWGDGIAGSGTSVSALCEDDVVVGATYECSRSVSRFVITEGNTGYVRINWTINYYESDPVEGEILVSSTSESVAYHWPVGEEVGTVYLDGPTLDLPAWGEPDCDFTVSKRYQLSYNSTCDFPE